MTLKEFYETIGADYQSTLLRMGNSERIVDKFVRKYPNEKVVAMLKESFDAKDYETAFRLAHTLKGLCANLGFSKLQKVSSELTEGLRDHVADNAPELLEQVLQIHAEIIAALEKLDT